MALRTGALRAVGAVPAELRDRSASVEEVLGASGRRLRDRMAGVSHPRGGLDLLLRFVRAACEFTLYEPDWRIRAFVTCASESRSPRVQDIGEALGVSPRCLRDIWSREVGFSPRRGLSVLRFRSAVREALRSEGEWSAVAHAVGYHDQSHLIRDFRSLVGETPTAFLGRGASAPGVRSRES